MIRGVVPFRLNFGYIGVLGYYGVDLRLSSVYGVVFTYFLNMGFGVTICWFPTVWILWRIQYLRIMTAFLIHWPGKTHGIIIQLILYNIMRHA